MALATAATAPAAAFCGDGEKPVELAVDWQDGTIEGPKVLAWQNEFNKQLNGKFCIRVTFNGVETINNLVLLPFASLGSYGREGAVYGLPFAFSDIQAFQKFEAGPGAAAVRQSLAANGFVPLGAMALGFSQMVAVKPVTQPGDVAGLKFGLPANADPLAGWVEDLKATAQVLQRPAIGEQIKATKMQATTGGWDVAEALLAAQPSLSVTQTNHALKGGVFGANLQWWNAMPAAQRKQIGDAITAATGAVTADTQRTERQARLRLVRKGVPVYLPTETQRKAWQTALAAHMTNLSADPSGLRILRALDRANRH